VEVVMGVEMVVVVEMGLDAYGVEMVGDWDWDRAWAWDWEGMERKMN
jgi:hypothetical protein